jgi:prepilin-type N-terminal cleavage/methylation domain-containing protein
MKALNQEKQRGFTLIELMIVVVIIGVLAALAVPRFMSSAAKSKQSEAKELLKQIYTQQRAYFMMFESYCLDGVIADGSAARQGNFNRIHVDIMVSSRYTYTMTAARSTFTCVATANIDDDAAIDTWQITDDGTLSVTIDDVEEE